MLSLTKVDLIRRDTAPRDNSIPMGLQLTSKSSDILKREGTEFWQKTFGNSNEGRLSSTIELGKERMLEKVDADYSTFLSKMLLQSLCRLQESEVLMYVRDCDIQLMRSAVIPWAVQRYAAKIGKTTRVHIDRNFRLNDSFKGRVVLSNVDRSLWVDNDVIAKVDEVAKNFYDRRNMTNESKGTLKYMNR